MLVKGKSTHAAGAAPLQPCTGSAPAILACPLERIAACSGAAPRMLPTLAMQAVVLPDNSAGSRFGGTNASQLLTLHNCTKQPGSSITMYLSIAAYNYSYVTYVYKFTEQLLH